MAKLSQPVDQTLLYEAALEGLELQKQRLDAQIQQVRSLLGAGRKTATKTASAAPAAETAPAAKATKKRGRRKRALSPEARKRIAEAQKKRWAEYHKANKK